MLDPERAPAHELAALYPERWEIETACDELKTQLRGSRKVLRSRKPELVKQEFHGLLPPHFVVRAVLPEAARQAGADPDRLSFKHAVNVLRRQLPVRLAVQQRRRAVYCRTLIAEILDEREVVRIGRRNERVVKRAVSPYPVKRESATLPKIPDIAKEIVIVK